MEVVVAPPPNFEDILRVFPLASRPGTLFTYGQTIYNPSGIVIPGQIKAHEAVHGQRQGTNEEEIRNWWARYLEEPVFRLEEELLAHRAEYRAFRGWTKDRNAVARQLDYIAQRLCGPLYGGLLTYAAARRMITVDVDPLAVQAIRRRTASEASP